MSLAQAWCRWNGQRGTEKQYLRVMRQLTTADLERMLAERGVVVPGVVPAPASPAGPVVEVTLERPAPVRQPDLAKPAQAAAWYGANCPSWRKGGAQ
jgi:hypothetical protein